MKIVRVKKFLLPFYIILIVSISGVVILSSLGLAPSLYSSLPVLGIDTEVSKTIKQDEAIMESPLVTTQSPNPNSQINPVSVQALPNIPAGPVNAVALHSFSKELNVGEYATFTWYVNGASQVIKTTTVYMGLTSVPGTLDTNVSPASTGYSDWVKEFINGSYSIPLNFTASKIIDNAGTWYIRSYAEINGKHYWGDEQTITVHPKTKHEVRLVNPPTTVKKGDRIPFTWEVIGPPASTWYTVIVTGRQSRSGPLDETIGIPQTPYGETLKDFANPPNAIHIPLQFIGTAPTNETGIFYYRALALINGKNIWSDEFSYTVTE